MSCLRRHDSQDTGLPSGLIRWNIAVHWEPLLLQFQTDHGPLVRGSAKGNVMESSNTPHSVLSAADWEELKACEYCDSPDLVYQLSVGPWTLNRCCNCHIVFTSPRLNEAALNRHYERGYYEGTAQYFASQSASVTADQRALAREVSGLLKVSSPASLDIGCGCGQLVEAFTDVGFAAAGTEPSEAACRAAAQLGRNVRNDNLSTFANESFDCVTAMHVLEHISHPKPFLAEITRITKTGGLVVIEVPNFGCKASRILGPEWVPLYPDTHLFHYTPVTLQRVLHSYGLVPIRVRRLGGLGLLVQPAQSASPNTIPIGRSRTRQIFSLAGGKSWTSVALGIRAPLLRIPGMRKLLRWITWEVLGHGEYVRVIARKTAQ